MRERTVFSKRFSDNWKCTSKEMNLDTYLISYIETKSKWMKDVNVNSLNYTKSWTRLSNWTDWWPRDVKWEDTAGKTGSRELPGVGLPQTFHLQNKKQKNTVSVKCNKAKHKRMKYTAVSGLRNPTQKHKAFKLEGSSHITIQPSHFING